MDTLKKLRKTLDSLPWIVTLLLTIFFDGIFGGLYRMTKGTTGGVVIGILWLVCAYVPMVFGALGSIVLAVLTIVDIVCVIIYKKITVLA
ncbi:MAG: hypothetical protein ACI3XX_05565 [Eubacteriales bacterium]